MTISGYDRQEAVQNLTDDLTAALVPGTFAQVSNVIRAQEMKRLRLEVDEDVMDAGGALYVIETPTEQQNLRAWRTFTAPVNFYLTPLLVGLIWMKKLEIEEGVDAQDVVGPTQKEIWDAVLEDPSRGGHALWTELDSDANSANTQGSRIYGTDAVIILLEWTRE